MKILIVLITYFSFVANYYGSEACLPANGAILHYNLVYFEEAFIENAVSYELVYFDSLLSQPRGAISRFESKLPAFWSEKLNWSHTYYWKINAYNKSHQLISNGEWHYFSTLTIVSQNKEQTRLKVIHNQPKKHAGGNICLDYSRSIYNRAGEVIWTLPISEWMDPEKNQIRDLKMTHENTITFLNGFFPIEIDLNGNLRWSAPYPFTINSDTVFYHHDFKKTKRGTYMVMANKKAYRKVLSKTPLLKLNKEFEVKVIDGEMYCKILMTLILEFNKQGEVIWFWDSNEYIQDVDLNYKKGPMGIPSFATHANAFSENEEGTKVYVGFRDLSRIVKIDKASKQVEQSYGEKYPSGDAKMGHTLFRRQHDATITSHHTILLLNNNSVPAGAVGGEVSSVLEIKEEPGVKDSLLVWKFDLNFDTLTTGKSISGGNVIELPNANLLVCAGLLNRMFEVTKNKEVVWDAFIEAKREEEIEWRNSPQYRCNWIKELHWYHFLGKVNTNPNLSQTQNIQVSIYNTGSDSDAYSLELINEVGEILLKSETKFIKPKQNLTSTLKIKNLKRPSGKLNLVIKSKHSAELKVISLN